MSISLKQVNKKAKQKRISEEFGVSHIELGYKSGVAVLVNSNGDKIFSSCISCHDEPCIKLKDNNIINKSISEFPRDKSNRTCPVDAIQWRIDDETPSIINEKCISCGLCLSACTIGAIYYNDGSVNIYTGGSEYYEEAKDLPVLTGFEKRASYAILNPDDLSVILNKIEEKQSIGGKNFPNIFTKNLLFSLGINAYIRRQGDTNIRMDMLIEEKDKVGVAEIEFGTDTLNSPRNILDNYSVLVSRYKIDKDNIVPIIFTNKLPNNRSDYWQVINDINNVLGIKISTVSIGLLILIAYLNKKYTLENIGSLYLDSESTTLREKIGSIIPNIADFPEGFLGIFEPEK